VEGGVDEPRKLLATSVEKLSELLGPTTGVTLATGLQKAMASMTEKKLMIASSCMPRGVGDTKLTALFTSEPDIRRWSTISSAAGWSKDALTAFLLTVPVYEQWRRTQILGIAYPIVPTPAPTPASVSATSGPVKARGGACFTGFRDPGLEATLKELGFTIQATVSKNTKILIIPDDADSNTQKIQKARELGVNILHRFTWREEIKSVM
jgi:hypothetical protein